MRPQTTWQILLSICLMGFFVSCKTPDKDCVDPTKSKCPSDDSPVDGTNFSYWSSWGSPAIDTRFVKQQSNGNLVVVGAQYLNSNGSYMDTGNAGRSYRVSILNQKGNEAYGDEIPGITTNNSARGLDVYGLAVDQDDNIVVAGQTNCNRANCSHTFASYTGNLVYDGVYGSFIAKWDSQGNLLWEKYLGLSDLPEPLANWKYTYTSIYSATLDSNGNILVTGDINRLTNGQLTQTVNMSIFLAKYDSDGNQIWLKILEQNTSGSKSARAIVYMNNEIFVGGTTTGNFNAANVLQAGISDAFLMKFDDNGILQWTRIVGSTIEDNVLGLRVGPDGKLHMFGTTSGNFDGINNQNDPLSAGNPLKKNAVFVVRYNNIGNKENSFIINNRDIRTASLEIDSNSVYWASSTENIDVDPLVPSYKKRPAKFKLDLAGNIINSKFGSWYEYNVSAPGHVGIETYPSFYSGYTGEIGCYARTPSATFQTIGGPASFFKTDFVEAW